MKKITAVVPDNVDAQILAGLLAIATEFRIDKVGAVEEPRKTLNRIKDRSLHSTIMEHYAPGTSFSAATAQQWVEKFGYQANGASATCGMLVKAGYLTRLGNGRWEFLKPFLEGQLHI